MLWTGDISTQFQFKLEFETNHILRIPVAWQCNNKREMARFQLLYSTEKDEKSPEKNLLAVSCHSNKNVFIITCAPHPILANTPTKCCLNVGSALETLAQH